MNNDTLAISYDHEKGKYIVSLNGETSSERFSKPSECKEYIKLVLRSKLPMREYDRIYCFSRSDNSCCTLCKNAADGCEWSRDGECVPGWEFKLTPTLRKTRPNDRTGKKIVYCPKFTEGDMLDGRKIDHDGCFELFKRIYVQAADDYREVIKEKLSCEDFLQYGSEPQRRAAAEKLEKLNIEQRMLEDFLGSAYLILQNEAIEECDGMASRRKRRGRHREHRNDFV